MPPSCPARSGSPVVPCPQPPASPPTGGGSPTSSPGTASRCAPCRTPNPTPTAPRTTPTHCPASSARAATSPPSGRVHVVSGPGSSVSPGSRSARASWSPPAPDCAEPPRCADRASPCRSTPSPSTSGGPWPCAASRARSPPRASASRTPSRSTYRPTVPGSSGRPNWPRCAGRRRRGVRQGGPRRRSGPPVRRGGGRRTRRPARPRPPDQQRHPRPITVHQDLLDEHPGLVDRFLAVLLRAADWAADRPDEVDRILGAETGAGAEGVAGAYLPGTHRTLHPDLSPRRLALLAEQEEALRAHGFLPEAVDIDSWADPAPLRRAAALNGTPALPPPATP